MKDSQAIVTPLGVSGASIVLDSPEWFEWLSERSSFSYQSSVCDYTCNKRSNGKWYASKRKGDRSQGSATLAQEYLGADAKLTKAKLEEIARKFALPDRDYWYLKHPKPTNQSELTESLGAGCTANEGTTSARGLEVEALKKQIEELMAENDALKTKLQTTEKRLEKEASDAQRYYPGWRKLPGLESELRFNKSKREELEQSVSELQDQVRSLEAGKTIPKSNLTLNKEGGFYQLRGKAVVYLEDLEKLGYQVK
ncbi:MAG: hypothetical protein ICV63_04230 [Coleofasciculus sp. Co-bin14]|nr:hypothetical protein [Coleofasciculus sp. Co-bin14]